MYDPRITGANLPGGMNANQFLGAIGPNGLVPGMAGNVAGQNWRVGEAEKFKEGSIWKGNRRKGVRYQIDWGDATAANPAAPAGPENNPLTGNQGTPVLDSKGNQITSDGSNMMWNSGNMPTLDNPNPSSTTNQPSAAVVANQSTVAPGYTDVVNPASEVNTVDQNANAGAGSSGFMPTVQTETGVKGIEDGKLVEKEYRRDKYDRQADRQLRRTERDAANQPPAPDLTVSDQAPKGSPDPSITMGNQGNPVAGVTPNSVLNYNPGEKPWENAPTPPPSAREIRQDKRAIKKENRQAARAMRNMANDNADQSQMPEVMQQAFQQQAYGGNVDPVALENAVALINRAFGGRIPRADNGLNLGSEDTDKNKIPDYLQAENLPANQPNPFNKSGTIEDSAGKKLDINWNQVGAAAGDMYANAAGKVTNFMTKMNAMNPERDMAKLSALNRPSDTYDTMKQGLYDQAGNFIPNDIGNQVLNPTDINFNNQRQIFSYGGRVYEIGGEVDLDDNELAELAAAGFKLSRV